MVYWVYRVQSLGFGDNGLWNRVSGFRVQSLGLNIDAVKQLKVNRCRITKCVFGFYSLGFRFGV